MSERTSRIEQLEQGQVLIIDIGESLEFGQEELSASVRTKIAEKLGVIVDLRQTSYIDAVGVGQLVRVNWVCEEAWKKSVFVVAEGENPVQEIIKFTRLDQVLTVRHSLDEALKEMNEKGAGELKTE